MAIQSLLMKRQEEIVSERIREYIERQNWTGVQAAEFFDVPLSSLRKWIARRPVMPEGYTLMKLSQKSGLPVEYFMGHLIDEDVLNEALNKTAKIQQLQEAKKNYETANELLIKAIAEIEVKPFTTIRLPFFGKVPASGFSINPRDVEEWIEVPAEIAKDGHGIIEVEGDCMFPQLEHEDRIIIQFNNDPPLNKIVVAQLPDGSVTLKRLKTLKGKRMLVPDNNSYDPLEESEARVIAVAVRKYTLEEL